MTSITPTRKVLGALPLVLANQVAARHKHAATCKKAPSECSHCIDNQRFFGEVPLNTLPTVLSNPQALQRRFGLRESVVASAIDAFNFGTSKRAQRTYKATEAFFSAHKAWHPEQYRKH